MTAIRLCIYFTGKLLLRHSGLNHRFRPRPLFSVFYVTLAYSTTLRSSTGTSRLRQQADQIGGSRRRHLTARR